MKLSSLGFYGIKGFHPGVLGLMQQTHNTTCFYPEFTRSFIHTNNCALMNEDFKVGLRNIPIDLIYPHDKLLDLILIRKTVLDSNIIDLATDDVIATAHPIAILNLRLTPSDNQTNYIVTLNDFKFYIMNNDKIEEITNSPQLAVSYFIDLNYRITMKNGKRNSEPMDIFIFSTSAWNKKSINDFAHLADFIDPSSAEISCIYKSYEDPMIYTARKLFLLITVPIAKDKDSKIIEYKGIPECIILATNDQEYKFPSTLYFKIQNYHNSDITDYIKQCLEIIIKLTIDNVNNIEEKQLEEDESSFDVYKAFIKHMSTVSNTKTPNDPYTLDKVITITHEIKEIIYQQLEHISSSLK